jgi:hypothetical protein
MPFKTPSWYSPMLQKPEVSRAKTPRAKPSRRWRDCKPLATPDMESSGFCNLYRLNGQRSAFELPIGFFQMIFSGDDGDAGILRRRLEIAIHHR